MKRLIRVIRYLTEPIDNEALSELREALKSIRRLSREEMKRISLRIGKTK